MRTMKLGEALRTSPIFTDGDWVESKDQDPAGDVRLLQLADVGVGRFLDKSARFLTHAKAMELRCTFLFPGDVLVARMPDPIGRACIFPGDSRPCVTVVDVCIVRCDTDSVDARYLVHMLNSAGARHQVEALATGSTRTRISRGNLAKVGIPLPPLPEQRRIAAILDHADSLRTKRRQVLAHLNSLSQSIFHEMFGDPDDASANVSFGQIAALAGGRSLVGDDSAADSAYRVLKISAVTTGQFKPGESKPLPSDYVPPSSHLVRPGDLLMSRANTMELVGAVAYVSSTPQNLALPDKVWRFEWKIDVEPVFWHALLSTPTMRRRISRLSSGTGGSMKNVSKAKLETMPLPRIELRRQQAFANRAALVSERRMDLERAQLLDEELFSSLQSWAFRGDL